jgi:hypothetical protein
MVLVEYENGGSLSKKVSAVQNSENTPKLIALMTSVACVAGRRRTVTNTERSSAQ